ncbi:MAG: Holliday junction resolvase RuvX [Pseudomonadota bacterium]
MAVYDPFEDFANASPNGVLLGIDFGEKTIGVAVSDLLRTVASPRETIKRKKFGLDADQLDRIITQTSATGLIIGLPLNMDGTEGPRCQKSRAFARNLSGRIDLPIGFWDERLSTVAAERALLEADMSRAKRAEAIDHVAAGYILQGSLDRLEVLLRHGTNR